MKVSSDRHEVVYKNEYNGKIYYSIKLAKKDEQGNWENGYISCRFKKGVNLDNRTHIIIKDAWLDFYLKDKITNVYLFINDFEVTDIQKNEAKEETKKDPFAEFGEQIEIEDEDLPF